MKSTKLLKKEIKIPDKSGFKLNEVIDNEWHPTKTVVVSLRLRKSVVLKLDKARKELEFKLSFNAFADQILEKAIDHWNLISKENQQIRSKSS